MIEQSAFKKLSVFGKLILGKAAQLKTQNPDGTYSTVSIAKLGFTDVVAGTVTASKALVLDSSSNLSTGIVGFTGAKLATEAGAGITGGTGTVYKSGVEKFGGIIRSSIIIDLTGLASSTTDLDIIGQGVSAAHIGQITTAISGVNLSGTITCLEAPAGGVADIDLYSATEATGKFDDAVTGLTETALVTSGGSWTAGTSKTFGDVVAGQYLYLTGGAAGTAATYTAGKFKIVFDGY